MQLRLGIDIACRAAHQASLADEQGNFVWTGRRFRTGARDLERLWAMLPTGERDVTVIMEPTRNAWVPLAAWFRRQGARVVLVPPERSSDLRAYYSKHTKTDGLDSRLLARLPLLHPEGLNEEQGLGPGDRFGVRRGSITAPPLFREAPRIGPLEGASSEHLGDRRGKGRVPSPLEGQSNTATPAGPRERRAAMGRRASSASQ